MPASSDGKNFLVNAQAGEIDRISLHTADPGDNGANEVTGGSPAYARKTPTWAAVGGTPGERQLNADLDFDVPACTVAWAGLWKNSGSVFHGKIDLTDEVFAAQGIYRLLAASTKLDVN